MTCRTSLRIVSTLGSARSASLVEHQFGCLMFTERTRRGGVSRRNGTYKPMWRRDSHQDDRLSSRCLERHAGRCSRLTYFDSERVALQGGLTASLNSCFANASL
jgi:hypothetical protein